MINENLGKLVQHARDKKPTDFKKVLTTEIDSRIEAKVSEIKDGLAKSMFKENCEGHPDGVEHTHEDGTVHTHEGGDKEHTHDEEVEEGTLPPALQKAIDAKKKNNSDDDDDEDKSPVGKKDENLSNFGNKKKIITKDDADGTEDGNDEPDVKDDKDGDHKPDKKAKKEDVRDAAKRILRGK